MKLETGKRYVTRDGKITSPLIFTDKDNEHPFEGGLNGDNISWAEDGKWIKGMREHDIDLVAEYMPDPIKKEVTGCDNQRDERLQIAATLGAGLLGKLNYIINTDRHDLFANDALALADALIKASKTPPTP